MIKLLSNKGKLGFGTLRLPSKNSKVNIPELCDMVDVYMRNGFNYFDLAHGYMNGQCEKSVMLALTSRYPRNDYVLCDKLTWEYFKTEEDIVPLFEKQLELCGVEFFDIYLLHALTRYKFEKFKKCNAFSTLSDLKNKGKIKHIGISFHDRSDFLTELLETYPEIEVVQIQFNYADYNSNIIESKKLYDICTKYQKPIIAMESVKGGSLATLPADAQSIFDELPFEGKKRPGAASYALRFVAGFENIKVVLSGMSNTDQVRDNVTVFQNFKPLSESEQHAIAKVRDIFNSKNMIQCTACRYCIDGCPKHILIPDMFACYNQKKIFNTWNQEYYYRNVLTSNNGKASDCIKCGICEKSCPQSLPIRKLLENITYEFEVKINDINPSDSNYVHAVWAVSNFITYLDKNGAIHPYNAVRKIDMIVFLYRFSGRPSVPEEYRSNCTVNDIDENNKFIEAVYWSLKSTITYVDDKKKYYPEKHCTRLDCVVYIYRLFGRPAAKQHKNIADMKNNKFKAAVEWFVDFVPDIIDSSDNFYPDKEIDRITIFRFLHIMKG